MKLYGYAATRSLRALWGLKELDLDFEYISINIPAGEHKNPRFGGWPSTAFRERKYGFRGLLLHRSSSCCAPGCFITNSSLAQSLPGTSLSHAR
jgi:hypothetical protein